MLRNKDDAEDAIQNTLLLAFEHLDYLRRTEKMKPWIMKILIRECYRIASERKYTSDIENEEITVPDNASDENSYIWDVVCSMSDNYRTVILLYYREGFSVREISHILEISEANVKKRLSRAREKLKAVLEEEYENNRSTN